MTCATAVLVVVSDFFLRCLFAGLGETLLLLMLLGTVTASSLVADRAFLLLGTELVLLLILLLDCPLEAEACVMTSP